LDSSTGFNGNKLIVLSGISENIMEKKKKIWWREQKCFICRDVDHLTPTLYESI